MKEPGQKKTELANLPARREKRRAPGKTCELQHATLSSGSSVEFGNIETELRVELTELLR